MGMSLGKNRYGKSGIHLVVVGKDTSRHTLTDLRVDIRLEGDFEATHTEGDNRGVLPTDTMRGTVFAFARQQPPGEPEEFGLRLARHFVRTTGSVRAAEVRLRARPWSRIGDQHPTAFVADGGVIRTARVSFDHAGAHVAAGIDEVDVLRTAGSAFTDYYVDEYTTLPETADRILATRMTVDWNYAGTDIDWSASATAVQSVLLETFADHDSASLQHTLYAMGEAVLKDCPQITDIHLLLPNRHHLLVDLSPYELDNPNEVFVAAVEPYGVIEATVVRD